MDRAVAEHYGDVNNLFPSTSNNPQAGSDGPLLAAASALVQQHAPQAVEPDPITVATNQLLGTPDIKKDADGHLWLRSGDPLHNFIYHEHPHLANTQLRVISRRMKPGWVEVKRGTGAMATSAWKKGDEVCATIRVDDQYQLTQLGREKLQEFRDRLRSGARRAKVFPYPWIVKVTMYCTGKGNCRRECGGFGKCVDGCNFRMPSNRTTRHYCQLRVVIYWFLDDLFWARVDIHDNHVPPGQGLAWKAPDPEKLPVDPKYKDIVLAARRRYGATAQQILSSHPELVSGESGRGGSFTIDRLRQMLIYDDRKIRAHFEGGNEAGGDGQGTSQGTPRKKAKHGH